MRNTISFIFLILFWLQPTKSMATTPPVGCINWDFNNQICTACDSNNLYYQVGNTCVKNSDENCQEINAIGVCVTCSHGFFLLNGYICSPVSPTPGCVLYSQIANYSLCLGCASNLMLIGNKCMSAIDNCLVYLPDINLCKECKIGYTQSSDYASCEPGTISFCEHYDCNGLCVKCSEDFPRLSVVRDMCLPEISFCSLYYGNSYKCKQCEGNRELTGDGKRCLAARPRAYR